MHIVFGIYMALPRGITTVHRLSETADAMRAPNRNHIDRYIF